MSFIDFFDECLQKWYKGAAMAAQKWAQECQFLTHDNVIGRHTDSYGTCGQNIFVATQRVPWSVCKYS